MKQHVMTTPRKFLRLPAMIEAAGWSHVTVWRKVAAGVCQRQFLSGRNQWPGMQLKSRNGMSAALTPAATSPDRFRQVPWVLSIVRKRSGAGERGWPAPFNLPVPIVRCNEVILPQHQPAAYPDSPPTAASFPSGGQMRGAVVRTPQGITHHMGQAGAQSGQGSLQALHQG